MSPAGILVPKRHSRRSLRDLILADKPAFYAPCRGTPVPTSNASTAQDDFEANPGSAGGRVWTGTSVAAVSNWSRGASGPVVNDAGSAYLQVPDNTYTRYLSPASGSTVHFLTPASTFTLECLFYMPAIASNGQMLWCSSSPTDGYPYFYIQRALFGGATIAAWAPRGNAGGAGSGVTWTLDAAGSFTNFPMATWHHLAMTWSGATKTAEFILNGVSFGTRVSTTDINPSTAGTYGLIFGTWYQSSFIWSLQSGSRVAEVAIHPSILSPARILAHSNRAKGIA